MSIVQNLKKSFRNFSIDIPRWEIPDQGITVLRGASGSGKTSVVRLLLGLDEPESLSWKLGDQDLALLPVEQRRLGVVFQNYLLFPHMTARQNILFGAQARGISEENVETKLKEWNSVLGLTKFSDRPAKLLSGGEQQRVALARALIGKPRFLFLDEPFSALDLALREASRELVKEMVSVENIPCLLISHDVQDSQKLASREFQIHEGRIRE